MIGPDMDIDMFLNDKLVDLGHIQPNERFLLLLRSGDKNWYVTRSFHYSNLGPQFRIMNQGYMKAAAIYPGIWTEEKWQIIENDESTRETRELYEERCSMMLRAMSNYLKSNQRMICSE